MRVFKDPGYTVVDLFSGCGGMSWGLHNSGFSVIAGLDTDDIALKTFKTNHPKAQVFHTDIRQLDAKEFREILKIKRGDLDCLIGGPPCQGFSKNVPAKGRFLNDHRNLLFRAFIEYVIELLPKVIIMENVAEIYNAYGGAVRSEIEETLTKLKYTTQIKVLFAPDFGVPQRRRRCFFFASRTGIKPDIPSSNPYFEDSDPPKSAWAAISDLPSLKNGEGYEPMDYNLAPLNAYQKLMRNSNKHLFDHVAKNLKEKQLLRIKALKAGQAWKDLPKDLQPKSGYSGAYGRLDYDMLAPTITRWVFHPGSGRFSHPRDDRLLTLREAARLQSFSDDFRWEGSYVERASQIGNAVPPLFMRSLAPRIKSCLS